MTDVPLDQPLVSTRSARDRIGDQVLRVLALGAAGAGFAILLAIAYQTFAHSHLAFSRFGLGFLTGGAWDATHGVFGARNFIYGTLITSFGALLIGAPLAIAIALFLNEVAPRRLRTVIASLIELLAAIPSVVLGLVGILVLGPFVRDYVYPALTGPLGWIPFFSKVDNPNGSSIMTAVVVLTIMVVPIIAAVTLEVLRAVPSDLKEGSLALGSTQWEMIRGVMLPAAKPGITAAIILGFGRAAGEAIAVTMVIGGSNIGRYWSTFNTGDTLGSRIANEFQNAVSNLQASSLLYLGAVLLAMSLIVNILAQVVVNAMSDQPKKRRAQWFGFAFGDPGAKS